MLATAAPAPDTFLDWQFWCTSALAALAAIYLLRSVLRVLIPKRGGGGIATPCSSCPEAKGTRATDQSSGADRVALTISARRDAT